MSNDEIERHRQNWKIYSARSYREIGFKLFAHIDELEKDLGSTHRALVELMEFCRTLIAMGAVETPVALKNELERAGECLKERA